jgi:hypothetical protein
MTQPVRMPLAHIRNPAFTKGMLDRHTCMQGLTAGCVASPAKNRVPATGAPSAALSPGSAPAAAWGLPHQSRFATKSPASARGQRRRLPATARQVLLSLSPENGPQRSGACREAVASARNTAFAYSRQSTLNAGTRQTTARGPQRQLLTWCGVGPLVLMCGCGCGWGAWGAWSHRHQLLTQRGVGVGAASVRLQAPVHDRGRDERRGRRRALLGRPCREFSVLHGSQHGILTADKLASNANPCQ